MYKTWTMLNKCLRVKFTSYLFVCIHKYQIYFMKTNSYPVSWGCRIHRLHPCSRVNLSLTATRLSVTRGWGPVTIENSILVAKQSEVITWFGTLHFDPYWARLMAGAAWSNQSASLVKSQHLPWLSPSWILQIYCSCVKQTPSPFFIGSRGRRLSASRIRKNNIFCVLCKLHLMVRLQSFIFITLRSTLWVQ